jgi:ubiquinone/menaquinone biosynthesis C-methylase UbiE
MNEEKMMQYFFEIHRDLPREGPGDSGSTRRAFSLLTGLPPSPLILDIGCGPGMQTMDLIEMTDGKIVAVDNHQPFLDQLKASAKEKGVADRITAVNADMAALEFEEKSFDLVWAEGSAYIIGFENALCAFKPFLKTPGYLAATEVAWLKPGPPDALKKFWDEEYPAIQDVDSNLSAVQRAGYEVIEYFVLPESAWWNHYYTPMEERLATLRKESGNDTEALAVVELHEREIDMYRSYSDYYGYLFFVLRTGS